MRATPVIDPRGGGAKSISALGLGCSQIGSLGHPASMGAWRALIDRALDLGVTVFDTADIYGQGDSERAIGQALAGRRQAGFVVTKVGKGFSPVMGALRPFKPILKPILARASGARAAVRGQREGIMREDFSPPHLRQAIDASLRRLRTEQVDVLLLHGPSAEVYRDPAVAEALADILAAGKAARIGGSVEAMDDLEAALAMPGLGALQLSLGLFDSAEAAGLTKTFVERGLVVMLREVVRAQAHRSPVDAVAAALGRPGVASVIVGTGNPAHLAALAALENGA
jgi:aryl-alcohol dehydrogenase-like predicted oxidoreductase